LYFPFNLKFWSIYYNEDKFDFTAFKNPSNISVTCSGRNEPIININGFDESDTYPPQSIMALV
jgi:hypothetical protein